MENKKHLIISIVIVVAILFIGIKYGTSYLYSSQYNENGVSHFLVITIDKRQPKTYIGTLDKHKIYIENLNLEETNFRNVNAENVPIKKAIKEKLISISEWRKYAWKVKESKNNEIYQFDNYEIVCTTNMCIIKPLD